MEDSYEHDDMDVAYADITAFDPDAAGDRGTHLDPQPAGGIVHVFVNGLPVVRNGVNDPEWRARRDAPPRP